MSSLNLERAGTLILLCTRIGLHFCCVSFLVRRDPPCVILTVYIPPSSVCDNSTLLVSKGMYIVEVFFKDV